MWENPSIHAVHKGVNASTQGGARSVDPSLRNPCLSLKFHRISLHIKLKSMSATFLRTFAFFMRWYPTQFLFDRCSMFYRESALTRGDCTWRRGEPAAWSAATTFFTL
mmetsp:Transcript_14732/g.24545  ORF Transcript_14732/g.24545 Transcript_14732/m.24545 type:complete len:108 (-) Transcript_14732:2123-2446(-)